MTSFCLSHTIDVVRQQWKEEEDISIGSEVPDEAADGNDSLRSLLTEYSIVCFLFNLSALLLLIFFY